MHTYYLQKNALPNRLLFKPHCVCITDTSIYPKRQKRCDSFRGEMTMIKDLIFYLEKQNLLQQRNQTEDEENLVLPSVREIIRQVEEMTLKNNSTHNSTTSLSRRQQHLHQQTANPGSAQHVSRSVVRPINTDQHGGAANRSHSASSILTNGGSLSRLINHDEVYHGSGSNSAGFYNDSLGKGVGCLSLLGAILLSAISN